jgi:hypothetical protein
VKIGEDVLAVLRDEKKFFCSEDPRKDLHYLHRGAFWGPDGPVVSTNQAFFAGRHAESEHQ